jgi:hypothetical protein
MADSQSRNMSENLLTNKSVVRQVGVELYTCDVVARKRCNIKNPVLNVHLFFDDLILVGCVCTVLHSLRYQWRTQEFCLGGGGFNKFS